MAVCTKNENTTRFPMRTNVDQNSLASAEAKFEPVARVLDHLSKEIEKEHAAVLRRRGAMQQTAQNTYSVSYSVRHRDDARLSLTFIIVEDGTDFVLVQSN